MEGYFGLHVRVGVNHKKQPYVGTFAALVFSCENSRSDHLPAADTVNLVSTPTVLIMFLGIRVNLVCTM